MKRRRRKEQFDMQKLKDKSLAWEYVIENALMPRERLFYNWATNHLDNRKITVVGRSMGLTRGQSYMTVKRLVASGVIDVEFILEKGRPYKEKVWRNIPQSLGENLKNRVKDQWVNYYHKVV